MRENINEIEIGKVLKSLFNGEFVVIRKTGVDKNRRYLYEIQFVETGYITVASSQSVKRGDIKDYYKPIVCGVGFLGTNENFSNYPEHKKLYTAWKGMLSRCYYPEHPSYKNYGGKDVTVEQSWYNYSQFFNDAKQLKGWDMLNSSNLELDKDGIIIGNKVYSKYACQWVTKLENNDIRTRINPVIVGVSPNGENMNLQIYVGLQSKTN